MSPRGIARNTAASDLPATIADQPSATDPFEREHAQQWAVVTGIRRSTEQHRTCAEHDRDERPSREDQQRHDGERIGGQSRLPGRAAVDLDRIEPVSAELRGEQSFMCAESVGQPQLVRCSGAGLQQIERRLQGGDVDTANLEPTPGNRLTTALGCTRTVPLLVSTATIPSTAEPAVIGIHRPR